MQWPKLTSWEFNQTELKCMVARKCQRKNKLQHNNFFHDTIVFPTTTFLTTTYNLYNNLKTSRQNTILFHNKMKA